MAQTRLILLTLMSPMYASTQPGEGLPSRYVANNEGQLRQH